MHKLTDVPNEACGLWKKQSAATKQTSRTGWAGPWTNSGACLSGWCATQRTFSTSGLLASMDAHHGKDFEVDRIAASYFGSQCPYFTDCLVS